MYRRYLFEAEKCLSRAKTGVAAPLRTVGVVGLGTMGVGIATSFLLGGFAVIVYEKNQALVGKALKTIETNAKQLLAKEGGIAGQLGLSTKPAIASQIKVVNSLERCVPHLLLVPAEKRSLVQVGGL